MFQETDKAETCRDESNAFSVAISAFVLGNIVQHSLTLQMTLQRPWFGVLQQIHFVRDRFF